MRTRPGSEPFQWRARRVQAAADAGAAPKAHRRARAGGTFALYSLLKRQAGLGVRGKAMASDRLLRQYSTGMVHGSPTSTLGWAARSMRRRGTTGSRPPMSANITAGAPRARTRLALCPPPLQPVHGASPQGFIASPYTSWA